MIIIEFSYHGHFQYPDFRYLMVDLDPVAKTHVDGKRWLPGCRRDYIVADVLDDAVWQQAKSQTTGKSLCYLGKQSHHFFGAKDLRRLMDIATQCVDYFVLEVPEPSLVSELPDEDDLSRPEMEDAGFQVALVDEPVVRMLSTRGGSIERSHSEDPSLRLFMRADGAPPRSDPALAAPDPVSRRATTDKRFAPCADSMVQA